MVGISLFEFFYEFTRSLYRSFALSAVSFKLIGILNDRQCSNVKDLKFHLNY